MRKFLVTAIAVILAANGIGPADAVSPDPAKPSVLISACSEMTGVAANLDSMEEAGVITPAEKEFIGKNHLVTWSIALRVLLPVFGVDPYPADLYPEIAPAARCEGSYADARCAAVTIGLMTEVQDPTQVMSASELDTLVATLRDGISLPFVETRI